MGGSGSSSRKTSFKRKRDKASTEKKKSRRKESNKKRLKSSYSDDDSVGSEHFLPFTSKSDGRKRKYKSKKLGRGHALSSPSADQTASSDSDYSSGRKGRKIRRSQVDLKSMRERNRKRSTSINKDRDAGDVRKRKRKRKKPERDHIPKTRKKSSKKKLRKHLSSSSSSDSDSYSTSQSGSTSLDNKSRKCNIALEKQKERVKSGESLNARKKHKVRSPSDHSASISDEGGDFCPVSYPTRLKSVIAVVNRFHDEVENRWKEDQDKEEITYDREDYPSPKSLDGYEGGIKMEPDKPSEDASSEKVYIEDIEGEELRELRNSQDREGEQSNVCCRKSELSDNNNLDKEKDMDTLLPTAELGGDELELILRQKALQNLRKFRGELPLVQSHTSLKSNEYDVMGPASAKMDIVLNKSAGEGNSSSQQTNHIFVPSLKSIFSRHIEVQRSPEANHRQKEFEMAKQSAACSTTDGKRSDTKTGSSSDVQTTSADLSSGDGRLEQQNDTKDGSQFEHRTMSVMRGGEMVQVSYKVYIPKKVPALARRQLRR